MSQHTTAPILREQLMALVRARAPRGRVMTLTEMEDAVEGVIRQVAGELMETLTAEQVEAVEKRGHCRPVAGRRRGGGAPDRGPC